MPCSDYSDDNAPSTITVPHASSTPQHRQALVLSMRNMRKIVLVMCAMILPLVTIFSASLGWAQSVSGRPYFSASAGAVIAHSRRAQKSIDGSETWLDYSLPGAQITLSYGGSIDQQVQLEFLTRVRYLGYGSVNVIKAPGFANQTLSNNKAGGLYIGGVLGVQGVYSFQPRNQLVSNGGENSGFYILGGLGVSVSGQTGFVLQPQASTSPTQSSTLNVQEETFDVVFAPAVSAGLGYEQIYRGLKVNAFYNFEAEFNLTNIEGSILTHSLNVGLRF